MIDIFNLEELLVKYNINPYKLLNSNLSVLNRGKYKEIESVLEYLINELKISSKNIEKCPSILYLNVSAIKENYEFLKSKGIDIYNIENCLHILSTNPSDLEDTYLYVLKKYGMLRINRLTSILRIKVDRIQDFEREFSNYLSDETLLSLCTTKLDIDEVYKRLNVLIHNNIKPSITIFKRSKEEIEDIINVCRRLNVDIMESMFQQDAKGVEKIILYTKIII